MKGGMVSEKWVHLEGQRKQNDNKSRGVRYWLGSWRATIVLPVRCIVGSLLVLANLVL